MRGRNRNSWIKRKAVKLGAAVLGACMLCAVAEVPWAGQGMMTEVQAEEVSFKDYLLEKWRNRETTIDLRGYQVTNDDVGDFVFQMYRYEAEYYYVMKTFEYLEDSDGYITDLYMKYGHDRDVELEAEAAKVLALIDDSMSDLEKALVIHDYLCLDVEYQENYTSSHEVTGPLLEKKAVCEGYAKAYKYYLDRAGVPCRIVTGYAGGVAHAWNQVQIDGKWYFVDATWDDLDTQGSGLQYSYFLCSGSKLSRDHDFIADSYEPCNDTAYENAFWANRIARTPMYAKNGSIYYIYSEGTRFGEYGIYRHDLNANRLSDRGSQIVPMEDPWEIYEGTGSYEHASFVLKDGLLYYSTPKAIYSCGLDGKNKQEIVTTEGTGEQIWSLKISGGTLFYETAETLRGSRTMHSHVLDADYRKAEYPISVQSPAVTISCGEEKYLNSFAPGTITYTSENPEICTVDAQGKISAVNRGKTKIILQTEETALYLPGRKEISVEVVPKDISDGYLILSDYNFTYNGSPQKPVVTVMAGYEREVPEDEYTVSYENNIYPGTATVVVTGNGKHYSGTLTATFTIGQGTTPVPDTAYRAEIAGYRLSLNGKIGVNFYMKLGDAVAGSSTSYMHFTLPDGTTKDVPVDQAVIDENTISGTRCHVFSCEVAAKEMTAEIRAQMMYEGNPVGQEYSYTVKQYAEHILENQTENTEYAAAAELVKSMLNYGGYAQKYFGYRMENLANESAYITEADKSVASVKAEMLEPYKNQQAQKNEAVKLEGSNLSLLSETTLRLYFSITEGIDAETVSFQYGGKTLEKVRSGNYYYVEITGIAAKNLGEPCEVTVTCGDTSMPVTYNVLSYCYNVLSRPTEGNRTQELKDVVAALYLYHQKAKDYSVNQA